MTYPFCLALAVAAMGACAPPPAQVADVEADLGPDATTRDPVTDQNRDSDGDGVVDRLEQYFRMDDRLGCCVPRCGVKVDEHCRELMHDGCGPGQTCTDGACLPRVSYACAMGETSPTLRSTFADGIDDGQRGTSVCWPRGARMEADYTGEWHLALPLAASYTPCAWTRWPAHTALFTVPELSGAAVGFISSAPTDASDIEAVVQQLQQRLASVSAAAVTVSSGARGRTHEGYDLAFPVVLAVTASVPRTPGDMARELSGAVEGSGHCAAPSWLVAGATSSLFRVRATVIRRFAFKTTSKGKIVLDANGLPVDSGKVSRWRAVVLVVEPIPAAPMSATSRDLLDRLGHFSAVSNGSWCLVDSWCATSVLAPGDDTLPFPLTPVATSVRAASGRRALEPGTEYELVYSMAPRQSALKLHGVHPAGFPISASYHVWTIVTDCDGGP